MVSILVYNDFKSHLVTLERCDKRWKADSHFFRNAKRSFPEHHLTCDNDYATHNSIYQSWSFVITPLLHCYLLLVLSDTLNTIKNNLLSKDIVLFQRFTWLKCNKVSFCHAYIIVILSQAPYNHLRSIKHIAQISLRKGCGVNLPSL